MTQLTPTRRAVFRDAKGQLHMMTRNGGVHKGYLFRSSGDDLKGDGISGVQDLSEAVRLALLEGVAVRCKSLSDGSQSYLRFKEDEITHYELGAEIAKAPGIPETGSVGDVAPKITRAAVEEAMDAFDRYRENGGQHEIFDHFGEPKDYWVRSTRDRCNRVYPTKPLVAYILKKTTLNGGWGQKADAAARLHNSGYIIVNQSDEPVQPPQRYDHLISDADRIRLCALNYFIASAREKNLRQVSIRAGDLAAAMGLQDAVPNICQALGGEKLQRLANVLPPVHTEPNPSSSTTFTYQLGTSADAGKMSDVRMTTASTTTNLILYGPPGTGKTYQTAWEAVRLCLGDAEAARFKGDANRSALMEEYHRLTDEEKRIEFVTFHQSMSYEEFVEGLRPTTGRSPDPEAPQDEEVSSGFRLEPQDGIFKRIR